MTGSANRKILFDLLPRDKAVQLLEHLGEPASGDPYIALSALKIRKGSVREMRLLEYLGLDLPDGVPVLDALSISEVEPSYPLFAHQRRAARKVDQMLGTGSRRVLLHMPTGAGKTRTAMHIIAGHLCRSEPTLVLWLAYSEELCQQAAEEFQSAWAALGNRDLDCMRFWGKHDLDVYVARDGLVVAGLAKVFGGAKRSIDFIATLADRTSLVIIDEAHQAIAESYRLILDVVFEKQPATSLLGLTATPGRTWSDIAMDAELSRYFSRRKVGLEVDGYDNPVDYLIDEGYLARPAFVPLTYGGGLRLTARDEKELTESLDIPERLLRLLADDEKRNLVIINKAEDLVTRHVRVLVFAATVEHARLLSTVLTARGVRADCVTAGTSVAERRRTIARFRSDSKESMILCNYGVLTTGFDAPKTSAAIIARPTKSLVLYFQMVGRAIRGPRAGGNETAEIVTVMDSSLTGFGDVGDAFTNWEDVWQ